MSAADEGRATNELVDWLVTLPEETDAPTENVKWAGRALFVYVGGYCPDASTREAMIDLVAGLRLVADHFGIHFDALLRR